MRFQEFQQYFNEIISGDLTDSPYSQPKYIDYVLLNRSRQSRWLKATRVPDSLQTKLAKIQQNWVLITEPWCGDSAHIAPLISLASECGEGIKLDVQLRDNGSEIEQYLTNGSKSIPLLIIRDMKDKDLAVWGPRPKACSELRSQLKAGGIDGEEMNKAVQKWYNLDRGESFFQELEELINETI